MLVAAAAVATAVNGVADRHAGSGASRAATAAVPAASATTAPADTIPVGDVRRLPKPPTGALRGALLVFSQDHCLPAVVNLARVVTISNTNISTACQVWVSPGGTMLALLSHGEKLVTAPVIAGLPSDTGLLYVALNPPLVTVADEGAVAECDGLRVLLSRAGRVRVMRTFAPVAGTTAERCVTGAIGATIVRLSADRRRLVDLATGQTTRRLSQPARRPIVAIAASSDGFVAIVDAADRAPAATVYGPGGKVTVARRPIGAAGGKVRKLLLAKGGVAVALGTTDGWAVTSLVNGRTLVSPGGAAVTDVAFSPDGTAVAETTLDGVVFAGLPDLMPQWFVDFPSIAVDWFDAGLAANTGTVSG